jgi:hypothetical protein
LILILVLIDGLVDHGCGYTSSLTRGLTRRTVANTARTNAMAKVRLRRVRLEHGLLAIAAHTDSATQVGFYGLS